MIVRSIGFAMVILLCAPCRGGELITDPEQRPWQVVRGNTTPEGWHVVQGKARLVNSEGARFFCIYNDEGLLLNTLRVRRLKEGYWTGTMSTMGSDVSDEWMRGNITSKTSAQYSFATAIFSNKWSFVALTRSTFGNPGELMSEEQRRGEPCLNQ